MPASPMYQIYTEVFLKGNEVVDEKGKATENIHAYSKTWGVWLNNGVKVYDSN
jgi:hypothetical protein